MIKRSLWILALTAALAACSSGVKLSEVPVEDKNASASASASTDAAQSSVAPVVGGKTGAQGVAPAGVNVVYFDYDSFALKPEARAVWSAMQHICKLTNNSKCNLKGTLTIVAVVNTTWPSVKSVLKRFAAH
jgi:peptidoglycan-associated lipoprotein